MLPFQRNNKMGAASGPVESINKNPRMNPDDDDFDSLAHALKELFSLMMSKRYVEAAEVFRSCQDLLDEKPKKKKDKDDKDKKDKK